MTADKSLLEKIRKLNALKERAGNEHEAAAAALHLRNLLEKHNLEIGAIDLQEEEGTELPAGPVVKRQMPAHYVVLAHACNELFDVQHFTRGSARGGWRYSFIGLKGNIEAAGAGFQYLIDAVEDLLKLWKRMPDGIYTTLFAPAYSRQDYVAFRNGCAQRIFDTIKREKYQCPETQELVFVGNAVATRMFNGLQFENVREVDTRPPDASAFAYVAGYEKGERVDPRGVRAKKIRGGK